MNEGAVGDFLRAWYHHEPPTFDYWLVRCSCKLIYQRLIPDDDLLADIYTNWVTGSAWPVNARDRHEILSAQSFLNKRKLKVLDYGAGSGAWSRAALKLGCDVYAVELSPKRAEALTKMGVTVLSDERGRFDFINMEQVLEHIPRPLETIRRLNAAVLKLSVPNTPERCVSKAMSGDMSEITPIHPLEHINCFTRETLLALASRGGWKEVRPSLRDRYSFLPSLPGGVKTAAKELIRPLWTFNNSKNVCAWFAPMRAMSPKLWMSSCWP